jgi:hypothetical protein
MFFLPPHDNPIAGDEFKPWVMTHLYDSPVYEQSLYVGYALLALAVLGAWRARREPGEVARRKRFARPLLITGAVTGLVIAIGPYIPLSADYWRLWAEPGSTAHVPSIGLPMFTLAPIFRFFTRAFVLVSLCLAALAAIGFARLELRFPRLGARVALAASALVLIALEFTNAPPHVWAAANQPPWVKAVRALPGDATVVDYPLAPANSPRSLYYMFWQRAHGRATVNPPLSTRAQALAGSFASPDEAASGRALRAAGIDYVVVHTALPPLTTVPYQPALPEDSMPADTGALNPWLRLVRTTPDARIYRVLDAPRAARGAVLRAGEGFGVAEPEAGGTARWLESKEGTLVLIVTGRPRPLTALITMASFARARRVTVTLGGRTLARAEVPATYTTIPLRLGRLRPGRYEVRVEATPGPQSIRAATGAPDDRSVSLRLREPVSVVADAR